MILIQVTDDATGLKFYINVATITTIKDTEEGLCKISLNTNKTPTETETIRETPVELQKLIKSQISQILRQSLKQTGAAIEKVPIKQKGV